MSKSTAEHGQCVVEATAHDEMTWTSLCDQGQTNDDDDGLSLAAAALGTLESPRFMFGHDPSPWLRDR